MYLFKGDSGYEQQPWLFTPIMRPQNQAERNYNSSHQEARHPVESCIGVWKSRFRCLSRHRILMYSPVISGTIITACAVLHNIMILSRYPMPSEAEIMDEMDAFVEDNIEIEDSENNILTAGNASRTNLVQEYFN